LKISSHFDTTIEPIKITMSPKVKLVYFDLHGRGEIARLCLHAADIPFDDCRVSFPEWREGKIKASSPFGQLPILYWETPQGKVEELAQSGTVIRFIARQAGLAGKTEVEFAQADMILEHTQDLMNKFAVTRWVSDEAARVESGKKLLEFADGWLQKAEDILAKRGTGWYAGDGLTFADLAMEVLIFYLKAKEEKAFVGMDNAGERENILQKFPRVRENNERVRKVPGVAQWIQSRPPFGGL